MVPRYDRRYTLGVKTAISIPDPIFARAEKARRKLKLSRSELYARAVERYLSEQSARDVRSMTEDEITRALDKNRPRKGRGGVEPALAAAQAAAVADEW